MNNSEKSKLTLSCVQLVVNVQRAGKLGFNCWVSAAGGTFNALCGYLSRKYNLDYFAVQLVVNKKMSEFWGDDWYQLMFDTIGCTMEGIEESLSIEQLLEGNF